MKILVEQGSYYLDNMGDVAMLQVAVSRFQKLWNSPEIYIITANPELLQKYCPGTHACSPSGRDLWNFKYGSKKVWVNKFVDLFYKLGLDKILRRWSPRLMQSAVQYILKNDKTLLDEFQKFNNILFNADLVIAAGGGYINDIFLLAANGVLNTFELAIASRITTAMFGIGLGPLREANIVARAKSIFPSINTIGLREKRVGVSLLQSFGASPKQIITTGDDAIELAYQECKQQLGQGIGVNLRIASYSDVNSEAIELVKISLQNASRYYEAPLVPIPISRHSNPDNQDFADSSSIQKLIAGYTNHFDGGSDLDTPQKVIENVSLCRVVITASYHGAVFALAQGIPVVALAKSEYYIDKFLGLVDQFSVGCEVVLLNDGQLEEKLMSKIRQLWSEADNLRPILLEAAERQVKLSYSAYDRVYNSVNSR